jgi:glycosyltransferase involved in cell wall biosynthesis
MAKKILFIDGQVFQSAAWDRGMGKYSLALLNSMLGQKRHVYEEVHIIFTKELPLNDEAKKLIKEAVPAAKHIFADLQVPFDSSLANIPNLQRQNQAVVDELLSRHSQSPDNEVSYLLLSLFIDQVCSVFPSRGQKILLFYDLIPLQYNERYGQLTSYHNYLARYKTIFEADIILTISQTVADDVALNLGISPSKIANIDGAPIERSAKTAKKPAGKLPDKYVLMPSGNDLRKNNIRAVQGFETYVRENPGSGLTLVVTSKFDEASRHALEAYSGHVIFTGNVSEEELRWLYEHAAALLFVSEYEGLGLPILEAAEAGKPIVCSDLAVFNEISPTAFYYSDPFDPFSIAEALAMALSESEFTAKAKEYQGILKKYTWANTAKKALDAIAGPATKPPAGARKRLAVLAPSPSGYSAIGKLVMQLHPAMQEYFDMDYYVEDGKTHKALTRPDYLPYIANVFPAAEFTRKKYKQYDAVLYHIGNSEFHLETIKSALYLPGYAIFHDTHLTNIFEGELLTYGYVTQNRLDAEQMLDKAIGNPKTSYLSSIANNQQGLVTHSSYTEDALNKTVLDSPAATFRINLPTAIPKQVLPKKSKTQLTIGLAGIIHPAKGLDVIESIAKLSDFYDCKIHIFGLSLVSEEVIRRLQGYPNVQVDTNVTDFQFQNMLSQLDILINFRPDYRGETSLATIEAMRFGVVPIVRKIGWYDELPDNAAVKVSKPDDLVVELRKLIGDPAGLEKMKREARKFISENHSYEAYAKNLYDFMSATLPANKVNRAAAALKADASARTIKKILKQTD